MMQSVPGVSMPTPWVSRTGEWQTTEVNYSAADDGPMLQLMPVKDGKHSEHTTLSFEVSEIERTVQEMEAKGVMFQDYDLPDLKTENHICTTDSEKCAWFMDSEHNILCVHENITPDGRLPALGPATAWETAE